MEHPQCLRPQKYEKWCPGKGFWQVLLKTWPVYLMVHIARQYGENQFMGSA